MTITYSKRGDYLIPNLILESEKRGGLGKYGLLRVKYLKHHQKDFYLQLLIKNELTSHLVEIEKSTRLRINSIIKSQAEEILLNELIYN